MAWALVVLAGLFEIGFAAALKQSDGFSEPVPTILFFILGATSFMLLSRALRSLPIGSAYAVWTGIGGAGTAIVGMVFLNEPVEVFRLVSIALILSGVVGLQIGGGDQGGGARLVSGSTGPDASAASPEGHRP